MTTTAAFDSGDGYPALQVALQNAFGIVVAEDQENLVKNRLGALLKQRRLSSMKSLAKALQDSPGQDLINAVLHALTQSIDNWNAPDDLFRLMDAYILKELLAPSRKRCRVWIVGDGQGQLPYSLAMHMADYRAQHNLNTRVEITASDISEETLAAARRGIYENGALTGLPERWRQQYMQNMGEAMQVNDDIKSMVKFEVRNLMEDQAHLGHHDLIICMGVMIYFSVAMKTRLLQTFSHLLDPSGILVTGEDEPVLPFVNTFERVEIEAGLFYRQRA